MKTSLFSRWLPCVTLAAWSGVLLYFAKAPAGTVWQAIAEHTPLFSGRIDYFLVPAFRPWVLVAALMLLVMALAFVFFPADAECCSTAECGHPLSRYGAGKWLTFLILIAPVSAAAFVTPDHFSSSVLKNRTEITDASSIKSRVRPNVVASATPDLPLPAQENSTAGTGSPAPAKADTGLASKPVADYFKRTSEGYVEAEVLDMLYASQDAMLRRDFEGKTVQLIAQLMPDSSTPAEGHRFKAARMFMSCCAADARPVFTVIEADNVPDLPEMTWIKVIAVPTFPIENGRRVAVLKATSVTKCDPPVESMLY